MEFDLVLQVLVGFCLSDGGWVKLPVTVWGLATVAEIEVQTFNFAQQ